MHMIFPVIDPVATGENILRLRKARGLSVRDLQNWFGFEEPQAIYKWQKGKSLPTVDNLYALGALLNVPMEEILVPCKTQLHIANGQQETSCCPPVFCPAVLNTPGKSWHVTYCVRQASRQPDPEIGHRECRQKNHHNQYFPGKGNEERAQKEMADRRKSA